MAVIAFSRRAKELITFITYFFHPACERYLAYILPMAPIPMRPMVGCASAGLVGLISGLKRDMAVSARVVGVADLRGTSLRRKEVAGLSQRHGHV